MRKGLMNAVLLSLVGLLCLQASAGAVVADRVVAVVGKEAIFKSDIDSRELMARMQNPELAQVKGLPRTILDGMIDQKIILAKAKIDSIKIDLNAVEAASNDRFQQLNTRFSSRKEMESRFGKSSAAIREEIHQELLNQELIDTLRRKKSAGVTVTYAEAMAFYKENKERLSNIPDAVAVGQIIKYPSVTTESRAQSLSLIQQIKSELQRGADFAELARKYSQDPGSAKVGGDLGYVQKGELIKSFEDAANLLKDGQVSDVVETRYGFHLIQMLNKDLNSIHVRHILIGFDRSKADVPGVIQQLNAIRSDIISGKATFADMASKYSDDQMSAKLGGSITSAGSNNLIFSPATLRPQLQTIISSLKNVGDISSPQKIEPPQGEPFYAIFILNNRIPAHRLDAEKEYALLADMALEDKYRRLFTEWVQMLRKEVYVRVSDI
ncbi:MAG: peptidylprolyl isomerase [Chlorobiaceae bacterium]|nr:peptidylprolyl isomerase [Chlorobiaceae bacterium]